MIVALVLHGSILIISVLVGARCIRYELVRRKIIGELEKVSKLETELDELLQHKV